MSAGRNPLEAIVDGIAYWLDGRAQSDQKEIVADARELSKDWDELEAVQASSSASTDSTKPNPASPLNDEKVQRAIAANHAYKACDASADSLSSKAQCAETFGHEVALAFGKARSPSPSSSLKSAPGPKK